MSSEIFHYVIHVLSNISPTKDEFISGLGHVDMTYEMQLVEVR